MPLLSDPVFAVTVALLRVAGVEEVGFEIHVVRAPPEVALLVAKQKKMEADDPFAVTDPFNVAPEEDTLVAAEVVTDGELAGIKLRTFP